MLALSGISLLCNQINAQTPTTGSWLPNNQTTTQHNLGVGTASPRGKQEILYCPWQTPQDGLIITAKNCTPNNNSNGIGGIENGGGLIDPNQTPVLQLVNPYFVQTIPSIFSANLTKNNLFWVRKETTTTNNPAFNFNTHFIVNSEGMVGTNTMNPRATFDIVQPFAGFNSSIPTAIFSKRNTGGPSPFGIGSNGLMADAFRTSQMLFFNRLGSDEYNSIIQYGDQAIIFSDGGNIDGSNVNGAFVIAPWASNIGGSISNMGGIRIDKDGNLDVHNAIRCRSLKVRPKWWADNVFNSNYNLMSLDSLNTFITENKHLPYFPSESEVIENGIEVAEIQAIHTKSLEELYLQVLQLNAILKKQQELINKLILKN